MLIVTSIYGEEEPLYDVASLRRKRKLNGEKSITFLVYNTERNEQGYNLVQEESVIDLEGVYYVVKKCEERGVGERSFKTVTALHEMFTMIDHYVYETRSGALQLNTALNHIFTGSGFTYTIVDSFGSVEFENFGDDNALALFQTVLSRYGAEFEVTRKHLTIKKRVGLITDFQFRYKHNLKTISKSVDTSNLSTYGRGYGKDGLFVEYVSPNDEANGGPFKRKHAKPVRDERFTNRDSLMERVKADMIDEPEISFTIDFQTLKNAGYPYEVIGEGYEVYTIYEPMNVDITARIMEIDEELAEGVDGELEVIACMVTISNFKNSLSSYMSNIGTTEKKVNKAINEDGTINYGAMDEMIKHATDAILAAETELEFNNGIIARDKDNPNYLVVYNSKGFAISKDGGQTFTDAITVEGFNLSAGVIGALKAIVIEGAEITGSEIYGTTIEGGTLKSSDTTAWADPTFTARAEMLNGRLTLESKTLSGGVAKSLLSGSGQTIEGEPTNLFIPDEYEGLNKNTSYQNGVVTTTKNADQSETGLYFNANKMGLGSSFGPNGKFECGQVNIGGLGFGVVGEAKDGTLYYGSGPNGEAYNLWCYHLGTWRAVLQ